MNNIYHKYDFVEYNGKICEVIATLDTFGISLIDGEDKIYENVFIKDVNPIPITDEILTKLGYVYDDSFSHSWGYRSKASFTSNYYPPEKKFTLHSRRFDCILPNTLYVHQMQHCLEIADYVFFIQRKHLE